jgi:Mitochondrial small ribosomal subunit Rsm22
MTWTELDWDSLDRHREQFLGGKPSDGPYWASESDLASYDLTFGERIGWKWDAVLDELEMRGWRPRAGVILDWGCGSGVAGRRVIGRFGHGASDSLVVWDHSPVAAAFAHDAARERFPGLDVSMATPGYLGGGEEIGLLVLSHVLNELQPAALDEVRALARRARAVLWTEPGNRDTSRMLGSIHDEWSREFRVVAPCTHGSPCPVLAPGNERHWCHHFAPPPPPIFADSNWVKFGQRAGIDLRSLPYSFLAVDRDWEGARAGLSRVIGRPEDFKPYVRLLNCDAGGLAELEVPKRGNKALCKELVRSRSPLVYRWTRDGERVTGGAAAGSSAGT